MDAFLVLLWVVLSSIADILFKTSTIPLSWRTLTGAAIYLGCSFFAYWTFKMQSFGWVLLGFNACQVIVSLIIAMVLFGEPFTIRRGIAATLILAAMFLIE
jgi:drug/metabolite transporter (DMT)-like permease